MTMRGDVASGGVRSLPDDRVRIASSICPAREDHSNHRRKLHIRGSDLPGAWHTSGVSNFPSRVIPSSKRNQCPYRLHQPKWPGTLGNPYTEPSEDAAPGSGSCSWQGCAHSPHLEMKANITSTTQVLRLIGFPTELLDDSRRVRSPAPAGKIEPCDGRVRVAVGIEP